MKSGISSDHVHVREQYGGGYPANVEGLHHLHCSLYYNYEYYQELGEGAFKNEEPILRLHVSHCLDILRQQLMCTVDVGVLGRVWWNKEDPTPFPDFNTDHKCRNFNAVRQWAFERQVPARVPEDYLESPRDLSIVHDNMP
ncbi:hypothetical protein HYALB_00011750 [Hymenoscyphus albidus]|uniref:Tat pathway signal sequence protein n=1 Tax=Hymenoscyphus albidus TaxID=595503 RepID=A0A9N9LUF6_9HELO|nr:hypothetical protein HYALB_00011750 [Hymenoscyphus albidus]